MSFKEELWEKVPEHTRGSLSRYIEQGIPPGDFVHSVLCNDLKGACGRADDINRCTLFDIVAWLYNCAPGTCWGSEEKVDHWIKHFEERLK